MSALESLEWMLLIVGFAALHVSWHALLVDAFLSGAERWAPSAPPRARYALALGLYLLLPVLGLATALWMTTLPANPELLQSGVPGGSGSVPVSPAAAAAPWLGLCWLLGTAGGLAGLAADLIGGERLRRTGQPVDAMTATRARAQAQRLGLRREPVVRTSRLVREPSVCGLLRPTVLLPRLLSSTLVPAELDGLLAHELAHVRRRDLAARAIQRAISALLFFHPCARRISRRIDRERELSCDDLVTSTGMPRRTYARALARVAMTRDRAPLIGLGAGSGDVALRVRRLLAQNAETQARTTTGIRLHYILPVFALSLWGLATVALLPMSRGAVRTAPALQTRVLAELGGTFRVDATDPAGRFTLSVQDGRAVGASIEGSRIPPSRIRQRGSNVVLPAGPAGSSFTVRIVAGGIEWSARSPG